MRRRDWLPVAVVAAACAGSALAQQEAIYRCNDGQGGVLYQNTACAGGRTVELQDAKPDPSARERLQRDLEAFERRQALREAAQHREREAERNRVAKAAAAAEQEPAYAPYVYPYAPYYVPPPRPLKPRSRPPRPPSYVLVR